MEAHPGMARTTDTFTLRCPRVGALGARVQIVIREIVEATIAEGLVPSPIRASLDRRTTLALQAVPERVSKRHMHYS